MEHIVSAIGNESWSHFFVKSNEQDIYLIDVRTPQEWQAEGIADFTNIKLISYMLTEPFVQLNNNFIHELSESVPDKNSKLYFICRSGQRSYKAAELAVNSGFKNCSNINGGYLMNQISRKSCK